MISLTCFGCGEPFEEGVSYTPPEKFQIWSLTASFDIKLHPRCKTTLEKFIAMGACSNPDHWSGDGKETSR